MPNYDEEGPAKITERYVWRSLSELNPQDVFTNKSSHSLRAMRHCVAVLPIQH
jgi:hypothetical protein